MIQTAKHTGTLLLGLSILGIACAILKPATDATLAEAEALCIGVHADEGEQAALDACGIPSHKRERARKVVQGLKLSRDGGNE